MSEPREVLNVEQAAEQLGFSAYTVREKARLGEIPGRKVGREWRFLRSALLRWLAETLVDRSPLTKEDVKVGNEMIKEYERSLGEPK